MDRRAFIQLAGLTGVALFAPWGFGSKEARAAETTWGGPYFLHMHASGGWDPTLFCDAKTTAPGTTPAYENRIVTAVREINGIFVPTAFPGRQGGASVNLLKSVVEAPAPVARRIRRGPRALSLRDAPRRAARPRGRAVRDGHVRLRPYASLQLRQRQDHWNVTSTLLVGPGIRGGRAIGKTDEGHEVLRVRPDNVTMTLPDSDLSGARIHPAHIHRELRRVLAVDAIAAAFPLPSTAPSFNPLPLLA